jgi:hypothetical protein
LSLTIAAAEEANRTFSSLLRSEIFDTSPQTETNQKLSALLRPEPPEITAPSRNLFNYHLKEFPKSEGTKPLLTDYSSIYSLSPIKSTQKIQLGPNPHPSRRPSSHGTRRGPFTSLSSRDFGTSKKGKELESAPGSMASHSIISNQSDDILQVSTAPLRPILNSQEADDLEILIASHLEKGSPGPEILSKLLSEHDLPAVRYIIQNHYHTVAQGEFEWLLDLREAGYSDDAILDSLLESTESGPWTTSNIHEPLEFGEIGSDYRGYVLQNSHQPGCVHTGPGCGESFSVPKSNGTRQSSECQPSLSFDKIESTRAKVAELCGIAGVYPPPYNGDHRADFEKSCVRVEYNSSPSPPDLFHSSKSMRLPWRLSVFFLHTTRNLCRALRTLQDRGLCCDRLTVLVDRADLNRAVVSMVPIAVRDVTAFHVAALELYRQHKFRSNNRMGQPLVDIEFSNDTELHDKLTMCWTKARALLNRLCSSENRQPRVNLVWNISLQLHECVLACQILAVAVVSYAQAHTGDFHPHFLKEPIEMLILQGYAGYQNLEHERSTVEVSYKQLACMGDLVGREVIVFRMLNELRSNPFAMHYSDAIESRKEQEISAESTGALFEGSMEDIIDSWGPAVLISDPEPGVPYGDKIKSVLIGSGAITRVTNKTSPSSHPLYHFGRSQDLTAPIPTFNIRDRLTIGAISVQNSCPLDPARCRKSSEPYLDALGTCDDHWNLAQRQMMLQAGQYVGLQVGNVYSKVKGRPLKTTILEMWRLVHDFRILLQPWGLQVSLCTGVARRVPLRELIEEPMFLYIDKLALPGWDEIKSDIRTAFGGTIDEYITWTTGLCGGKRECLIQIITFSLEVLKDTGVDREGKRLRLLWPDESSLSHAISLKCDKSNLWARVLQDSPSCATFAALTSKCLEAPSHSCKKNPAPIWTGKGALLSTAVCRVLVPGDSGVLGLGNNHWELQNGQRCWIGKAGSEVWVYTSKTPNSEAQLTVKINRFPKGLSILRDWQVLRERQDSAFEAEEVVVYGTMA